MLIAGTAVAGVRGVPPATRETCCDCQRDDQGEPAARSVESPSGWLSQRVIANPSKPRMAPKPIPIMANQKADPTQNESSKVNERKKTAEKLVIHTFRLATQRRA
jgi:hypothetical protein